MIPQLLILLKASLNFNFLCEFGGRFLDFILALSASCNFNKCSLVGFLHCTRIVSINIANSFAIPGGLYSYVALMKIQFGEVF